MEPLAVIERYAIYETIGRGGMATIHLARQLGGAGFSRTVAIKRLHPHVAAQEQFVRMMLDEAHLASRVEHPNVVRILDVVEAETELFMVQEYAHALPVSTLAANAIRAGEGVPPPVAIHLLIGTLRGLHAAHTATGSMGEPLHIVHRDVSPQNIMVGADGVALVLDFGVAKAAMRASTTRDGQIKGKIAYMAPEQFGGGEMDRRVDVFAAGVVLWEALTSRRLFAGQDVAETLGRIASGKVEAPSKFRPEISPELDAVVLRALASEMNERFPTALAFAEAIEGAVRVASAREIGAWVDANAALGLGERSQRLSEVESSSHIVAKQVVSSAPVSARTSVPAEVSDLSTARTLIVAPGRRSALPKVLGFAAAGLGGAVLVLLIVLLMRPGAAQSDGTTEPSAASPQANAERRQQHSVDETPAPPQQVPAAPAASAEPVASAQPVASAEPLPAMEAEPRAEPAKKPATAVKPRVTPPPAPKPAKPKVNCNPPYSIDAQGIKRVKPECL